MSYFVYLITSKDKKKTISYVGYTNNLDKKYDIKEIVKGDSIFCATGITSCDIVSGIKLENRKFITETLVTHKYSGINIVKKEITITWLYSIFAIKDFSLVPSSIG